LRVGCRFCCIEGDGGGSDGSDEFIGSWFELGLSSRGFSRSPEFIVERAVVPYPLALVVGRGWWIPIGVCGEPEADVGG